MSLKVAMFGVGGTLPGLDAEALGAIRDWRPCTVWEGKHSGARLGTG